MCRVNLSRGKNWLAFKILSDASLACMHPAGSCACVGSDTSSLVQASDCAVIVTVFAAILNPHHAVCRPKNWLALHAHVMAASETSIRLADSRTLRGFRI